MDIKQWGPAGWNFMHAISFAYPDNPTDEEKENAIKFFSAIPFVLPCKRCKDHFKVAAASKPISEHVGSMDALSRWVVDLHNAVNLSINRPIKTYDETYHEYMGPLVAAGLAPFSPTVSRVQVSSMSSPYGSPSRASITRPPSSFAASPAPIATSVTTSTTSLDSANQASNSSENYANQVSSSNGNYANQVSNNNVNEQPVQQYYASYGRASFAGTSSAGWVRPGPYAYGSQNYVQQGSQNNGHVIQQGSQGSQMGSPVASASYYPAQAYSHQGYYQGSYYEPRQSFSYGRSSLGRPSSPYA